MKKFVPSTGEVTVFVYDAAGKQIAEYSTIVEAAQDANVSYLTNDHLGSQRINTDATGAVTARHDDNYYSEQEVCYDCPKVLHNVEYICRIRGMPVCAFGNQLCSGSSLLRSNSE
ncbi:MAG: hypothetical protein LC113_10695 [Acidobacteria bacterium]|nr:hypothetical protein [Acidobacteriota bacterium]